MPIYTYHCESCGIQFEKTQSFSDQPLTRCPECNKKALRKVYTPVGIVFKGSGFYATDHRSPSGQNRWAEKTSGDKPAESASASTPGDSNAAATPSTPASPEAAGPKTKA